MRHRHRHQSSRTARGQVIQDEKQVRPATVAEKPAGMPTVQGIDPIDKPVYVAEAFDAVSYSRRTISFGTTS
jgi:hypothetical protein